MKRIVVNLLASLLLCIITHDLNAQFYLGLSKNDLIARIKELKGENVEVSQVKYDNGSCIIIWKATENLSEVATFGTGDNVSSTYSMICENNNTRKALTEIFNKDFTIISSSEWKCYQKDKIYQVTLKYMPDTDSNCFTFIREQ